MKNATKLLIIIIIMFILSACHKQKNDADRLEFYINRRIEETNDYVMDESPIFTGKDILSYEWDTHTIIFNDDFLPSNIEEDTVNDLFDGGSKILGVYYPDQFVIYLDGKELYRGIMKPPAFISFMPSGPLISDTDRGIVIRNLVYDHDVRNNTKLYEFLEENDLLK